MSRSFRDAATARLFADEDVPRFRGIERQARRKLLLLDGAGALNDLRTPPGNRLEALKGDRRAATFDPYQRSMARLFYVAGRRRGPCRNRGLSLAEFEDDAMAKVKRLDPIPPGEILLEEFMRPNGISQNRLARDLDVNPARVNDIVHGRSAITAPFALRLAKYFGTTPELWMNLQGSYELRRARATDWPRIERRVRVLAAE